MVWYNIVGICMCHRKEPSHCTLLGREFGGLELSGGEWQKLMDKGRAVEDESRDPLMSQNGICAKMYNA